MKNVIISIINNKIANDNPVINTKSGPLLITSNVMSLYMLSL